MTRALLRPRMGGILLLTLLAAHPREASAATWGSFDGTRMAYTAGTLDGSAHVQLQTILQGNGDQLAPPTGELSAEYLATVDVFYTGLLSDGTGPTAGAPGTLSIAEQNALADFIADGGTLIVSPDSNGFEGPFPLVYDSWLQDYGLTDFSFVPGPGLGQPLVAHRITEGVAGISLDGTVSFSSMAEAQPLATAADNITPLMVVLEPGTGFVEGGRILVLADHNSLTNNYIAGEDNNTLAQNIVEWAAGDCGNGIVESNEACDDGNSDDTDGCNSQCMDGGGETSGGEEDGAGDGDGDETDTQDEDSASGDESGGESGEESSGLPGSDESSDAGCSCSSTPSSPASALAPLMLVFGLRLRRRKHARAHWRAASE